MIFSKIALKHFLLNKISLYFIIISLLNKFITSFIIIFKMMIYLIFYLKLVNSNIMNPPETSGWLIYAHNPPPIYHPFYYFLNGNVIH
jgi:hypothetical protein